MTGLSPRQVSYETWLSHLPPNQVLRFKDIFEIRKRPNGSSSPQVLSLTNKGIIERDISNNEGQLAESYDNYQVVEIGDFVLNPMDLLSGWVARSSFDGVISNAYFVFRLRSGSRAISSNPVFYELLLQSYYTNGILEPFGKGVGRPENGGGRWTLNSETLSTIPFPNFPLVRQDAIVAFLDRDLQTLNKLSAEANRLLSLILERKPAIIKSQIRSFAGRTKRDKLSRLVQAKKGPRANKLSKESLNQDNLGFPVYSGQTAAEGIIGWDANFDFDFPQGVVLATTVGANAMSVKLISGKFSLSQNCMIIWSDSINAKFLAMALSDLFSEVRNRMSTHMQPSFRMADLQSLWLEFPESVSACEEIQKNIESELSKMDLIYAKSEILLESLEIKRRALIREAVTGKIVVGGF